MSSPARFPDHVLGARRTERHGLTDPEMGGQARGIATANAIVLRGWPLAPADRELAGAARAHSSAIREDAAMTNHTSRLLHLVPSLFALSTAVAKAEPVAAAPAASQEMATETAQPPTDGYRLGAHAEVDLGILIALQQGTAIAGGVTYGPFRAGLSYGSFLSNPALGGVPDGFDLRVNCVVGINAAYFIGQDTDSGLYVQAMFHIKQQGVTDQESGAHVDLDSLALGMELGYVWKVYEGLYLAPRVGALRYLKTPQPGNQPVAVGDRLYDNDRHKDWDTYFIPTLSVGYSW